MLDIGCGRGEFLEMMQSAGIPAKGIDLSEESVATCRHKGLDAEVADLFVYLENLPEASLDGIFCSQVVEHLPPERLPEMIRLCASRLQRNGVLAIETPNPECLAIFATHFYLDPTHQRPVPHPLLAFYLEEFGVGNIEVRKLSPAAESMPSVKSLPEDFREAFFGGLGLRDSGEEAVKERERDSFNAETQRAQRQAQRSKRKAQEGSELLSNLVAGSAALRFCVECAYPLGQFAASPVLATVAIFRAVLCWTEASVNHWWSLRSF